MIDTMGMLWRIAKIRIVLFSVATLWTCWSTATSNLDMTLLKPWDWFQTIGGCFASWCMVMMAFLDKSAGQISQGHIPGIEVETKNEAVAVETKL
jgi:hypothetical protein